MDDAELLRAVADRLERLARLSTSGDWRIGGLLATRPDVVAHRIDGGTEHVAEARAGSAGWIAAVSPAVAEPLATWLRDTAAAGPVPRPAVALARLLADRLSRLA